MKSPNSMNKSQEWRFSNLNSTFNKSEKNINNLEGNKKNFLLDYVFKSDKLSALKNSDKKPKIGESYTKTETSYNSKFAKSSKIAEKFEQSWDCRNSGREWIPSCWRPPRARWQK